MVYVSDHLRHDKTTLLIFLNKLLCDLITTNGVKKVDTIFCQCTRERCSNGIGGNREQATGCDKS